MVAKVVGVVTETHSNGLYARVSFEVVLMRSAVRRLLSDLFNSAPFRWTRRNVPHKINFGDLRRLTPISSNFGYDRGLPGRRYYIENFLSQYAQDIHGHVLEIGDDAYTRRYGGNRVTKSDVLHVTTGNPKATIVADLCSADCIASDTYDCIIFTQTLQCIYDVQAAIRTLYRILKPGGIVLASFSGIAQLSGYDMERWGEHWRFTRLSVRRLFEEVFLPENVEVRSYGNVLTAIAFLHGLAAEELSQEELGYHDPNYEVMITLRAVKG